MVYLSVNECATLILLNYVMWILIMFFIKLLSYQLYKHVIIRDKLSHQYTIIACIKSSI